MLLFKCHSSYALFYTRTFNATSVICCSSSFLPVYRKRYFWGNIPDLRARSDAMINLIPCGLQDILIQTCQCRSGSHNDNQLFKSILRYDILLRYANELLNAYTSYCSLKCNAGKGKVLPIVEDGEESALTITEREVLLGFSKHYTDVGLSLTRRNKLLGKSWRVPVITYLLQPLADMYVKARITRQ